MAQIRLADLARWPVETEALALTAAGKEAEFTRKRS